MRSMTINGSCLRTNGRGNCSASIRNWSRGAELWEMARQRGFQEILEKGLHGHGPYREEMDLKGPVERNLAVYVSRLPGQRSPGAVVVIHDTTGIRRLERMPGFRGERVA